MQVMTIYSLQYFLKERIQISEVPENTKHKNFTFNHAAWETFYVTLHQISTQHELKASHLG